MMAEVYRAGRVLFPASEGKAAQIVTLQVSALKEVLPVQIGGAANEGSVWVLVKRTDNEAAVEKHRIAALPDKSREGKGKFEILELWSNPTPSTV